MSPARRPVHARRHASRVGVYHAEPTGRTHIQLLGVRPSGTTAADHRADRCDCRPLKTLTGATWNASCPPPVLPGAKRAFGVVAGP